MRRMIYGMELESIVSASYPAFQRFEPVKRKPVNLRELIVFDHVFCRIEVVEIAEDKAEGVSYSPVRLGESQEDLF